MKILFDIRSTREAAGEPLTPMAELIKLPYPEPLKKSKMINNYIR